MWPTENPWPAIILCICVAILLCARYGSHRKLINLVLAAACLMLAAGCFLLDQYVQTPAEIIAQHVYDLTKAVRQQNVQQALSFFSPQSKERPLVVLAMTQVRVNDDLHVSDLSVSFKSANSLAISHFRANASLHVNLMGMQTDVNYHPSRWELDWRREAGEWKIIKVHRLNPITGKETPFMAAE